MKFLTIIILAVLCSATTFSNYAGAETRDTITSRIPAKIHVVQNFEDWNDVLIRFTGMLRNSCYTKEGTTVRIENDQIYIDNLIRLEADRPCLAVLTPYSGQIAVRDLQEGTYDVLVRDKYGVYQEMTSFKTE